MVREAVLRSEPCRSCFVDALNNRRLSRSLKKYVCVKMTHGSLICASKFKSVRNRPAVVRYREHCLVTVFSFIHNTQISIFIILLLFLVLVGCVCDYDAQISFV